jgi:site-specific DNA-adenine methylase
MSYLGSKAVSGAYQAIIAQMPPHDTYIETHLGSGAVLRIKPPATRSIGIEIDRKVLAAFDPPSYPVELRAIDAVKFLKGFRFARAGRVLIYADPPYLHETRTSTKRYRHEYTAHDHRQLLATLRTVPASVMISGYPSKLYDALLADWRSIEFQAMTRGGVRTEKLWMNFRSNAGYWATFAGIDRTDRQRIKRKAARWAKNYHALAPAERIAVLAALMETHQGELLA